MSFSPSALHPQWKRTYVKFVNNIYDELLRKNIHNQLEFTISALQLQLVFDHQNRLGHVVAQVAPVAVVPLLRTRRIGARL